MCARKEEALADLRPYKALMINKFSPQREHDIYLMDLVTCSDAFTNKEAAILNHCHMYLTVTMLSDISTAKGDKLIPGIKWGEIDLMPLRTKGHINHQQAPTIFFWTY
jgi:hypothetical protein